MGYSSTSISTTEQCRTAFPSTSTSTSHRSQFPVRWCRLWISVAAIANDRVDADLLTRHSRRSTSSEASGSESRRRCVSFFSIFLFFIFFFLGGHPSSRSSFPYFFYFHLFIFLYVCVCVRRCCCRCCSAAVRRRTFLYAAFPRRPLGVSGSRGTSDRIRA